MIIKTLAALLSGLSVLSFGVASAQETYPTRPIKLLVSVPPGGAPDLGARIIAEKLSERLKQPVVVENRPGSNGNIAGDAVAKASPDGHTLLFAQDSIITINPSLYKSMPFDPLKDLVPVSSVAENQFVLSINSDLPAKTFAEFLEVAKSAKPPLAYASGGNGSQHHIAMEMLKQRAGLNLTHVPYRGGSPATTATVAGETAAMFAGTSSAPQIKSGKLRGFAVTGSRRSDVFPDLPMISEFFPGYEITIWLGVFAPAQTPDVVLTRLREEIRAVLTIADIKEKLAAAGGLEPFITSPDEFKAVIRQDHEKYHRLVGEVGIKLD